MRSMGITRSAPNSGLFSARAAPLAVFVARVWAVGAGCAGLAPGVPVGVTGALPGAAVPAAPATSSCNAASTSCALTCLRGNTPTDMPCSKLTSNVLTKSSHPSACEREPASTSRLRTVSTRTRLSAGTIGRKIEAISVAPMYCSGTMMAPLPGGRGLPGLAWRTLEETPRSASGRPTW